MIIYHIYFLDYGITHKQSYGVFYLLIATTKKISDIWVLIRKVIPTNKNKCEVLLKFPPFGP